MRTAFSLAVAASAALGASAMLASSARAELIYGMTTADGQIGVNLVSFDSATPHISTVVGPLTGGVNLRAMDFRPSNGLLYAVGYTPTGNLLRLFTVSTATGACTPVAAAVAAPTLGTSTRVSVGWDPISDQLRVISGSEGNVRMSGAGALAGTDPNLGTTSIISGMDYNTAGSAFGYNFSLDTTVGIVGPTGVVSTIGPTGGFSAFSADNGVDISFATGVAYGNGDDGPTPTLADELYTINLVSGAWSVVPTPNAGNEMIVDLIDISVAPIPEPTTLGLAAVGLMGLATRRRRA